MIWVSVLLIGLAGCGDSKNDHLLDMAEVCMETRADSARWLLQQVDSVMTDGQRARYALLWTQALHKCRIPLENDSLINVAVDYYTESDDRHRLAKSLLYKGLVHKQRGEVEQAVEAFVASERAFKGVEDDLYKALLFNHYALLLLKQGLYEDALGYYKKTYQCDLLGDSIHYIISTCGQIAKIYDMKEMPDSAEAYYKQGMSHAEKCQKRKYVDMLYQNYGVFLIERMQYEEAEQLLKKSERVADSTYIYNVYSALATLYYKMGKYEEALPYGERILECKDSLMLCGGYLHLYRIHKQLGNMDTAVHYHDLYRQYHSDIAMRQRTAEVAAIPHQLKSEQLIKENRTAHRWQWAWGIGALMVVGIAACVVKCLRQKYGNQMRVKDVLLHEKEHLLTEKQSLLQEIERKMYDLKIELGRMKGALANQAKAVENLKDDRQKDRKTYHESVKEFKKSIQEMEKQRKAEQESVKQDYRELKLQFELSQKEQTRWMDEVKSLSGQMEQYELLQRFLLEGGSVRPVLLILELKSGRRNPRYSIKRTDYAELLKQLAEYAHPGIREKIETDEVLKGKQEMACLIALGYDDVEMMRMATNLKPNSVWAYRTQVRVALADGYGGWL